AGCANRQLPPPTVSRDQRVQPVLRDDRKREMLLKVEEYILLAKLRAILRKEEEKPEEERGQQFIALPYETMAHLERDQKSNSKSRPGATKKRAPSTHRRRVKRPSFDLLCQLRSWSEVVAGAISIGSAGLTEEERRYEHH